jgi:dTDP-L-rhamnose 4-epimerase
VIGQRVLVSGHRGFIGSYVAEALRAAGDEVVLLHGDVRRENTWKAYQDIDVIVHLAARVGTGESMYRSASYTDVNVTGMARMIEHLKAMGSPRVVLASSSAVYAASAGPLHESSMVWPHSVYGLTKQMQEALLRVHEVEHVTLRVFAAYGPGQSLENPYSGLVGFMAAALLRGESPPVFEDGNQRRDLVHVQDVAHAFVMAVQDGWHGQINIGTGVGTSVMDLVSTLRLYLGGLEPTYLGSRRLGDVRDAVADVEEAKRRGWEPLVDRDHGLKEFCDWAREREVGAVPQAYAVQELQERGLVV